MHHFIRAAVCTAMVFTALQAQAAYFNYIKALESSKIWLAPSSVILLLSLPLLHFAELKLHCLAFLVGVP